MNAELRALLKDHGFAEVNHMLIVAENEVRDAAAVLSDDPTDTLMEWGLDGLMGSTPDTERPVVTKSETRIPQAQGPDTKTPATTEPDTKKRGGPKAPLRNSIMKILKEYGPALTAGEIAERLRSRQFEYDPGVHAPKNLKKSVEVCLVQSACFGSDGRGCGYRVTQA